MFLLVRYSYNANANPNDHKIKITPSNIPVLRVEIASKFKLLHIIKNNWRIEIMLKTIVHIFCPLGRLLSY